MCFFNSAEQPIWNKMCVSALESHEWQSVFLSKLPQFSQRNNVLDVPHSNIDGFPLRDTRVSSTQLKSPTGNKKWDSNPLKLC
jgi:hypothetical protein